MTGQMSWLSSSFVSSGKSFSGSFLSMTAAGTKCLSRLSEKKELKLQTILNYLGRKEKSSEITLRDTFFLYLPLWALIRGILFPTFQTSALTWQYSLMIRTTGSVLPESKSPQYSRG